MRASLAVVLMTGFLFAADQPLEKAAGNDKEKLQGTWMLVSNITDGKDRTDEMVKQGYKAVIKGDKITLGVRDDMRTSSLVIDPTSQPKKFDILISLGIYELKGDELKVCLGGDKRPTEFTSKAGSENVLMVFKRVKQKP